MKDMKNLTLAETNDEIRRIRNRQILQERLAGLTYAQIGKNHNLGIDGVKKALVKIVREEGLAQFEEQIVTELANKAIQVYAKKLDEGSEYVARHVLDIVLKLSDRVENKQSQERQLGLQAYLANLRAKKDADKTADAADNAKIVNGTVERAGDRVAAKTRKTVASLVNNKAELETKQKLSNQPENSDEV